MPCSTTPMQRRSTSALDLSTVTGPTPARPTSSPESATASAPTARATTFSGNLIGTDVDRHRRRSARADDGIRGRRHATTRSAAAGPGDGNVIGGSAGFYDGSAARLRPRRPGQLHRDRRDGHDRPREQPHRASTSERRPTSRSAGSAPGEGNSSRSTADQRRCRDAVQGSRSRSAATRIYANAGEQLGGLGIDLLRRPSAGVTPNDPGDGDTGANGFQNFSDPDRPPVRPSRRAAARAIQGVLNSAASTTFDLDFYSNPALRGRPAGVPRGRGLPRLDAGHDGRLRQRDLRRHAAGVRRAPAPASRRRRPTPTATPRSSRSASSSRSTPRRRDRPRAAPRVTIRGHALRGRRHRDRRRRCPRPNVDVVELDHDHGDLAGPAARERSTTSPSRTRRHGRDAAQRLGRRLPRRARGPAVLRLRHDARRQRHHGRLRRRQLRPLSRRDPRSRWPSSC